MSTGRVTVVEEKAEVRVTEEVVSVAVTDQAVVLSEQIVGIPGKGDAHYVHEQEIPSATWEITHGLGKNPAVTVVDSGGTEWKTSVEHISENEIVIRFSAPFSGRAYLN